jgi:hypothetical protein
MLEHSANARHLLRRKLSFGIPALTFLSLAALEPIEIGSFAETLASLNAEPISQNAPVIMPALCVIPSDSGAGRKPRQMDI